MSSEHIKELTALYERYEEKKTEIKALQDETKDLKNMMIEIMQDKGIDSAIVAGLDTDAVELQITVIEEEKLNKKVIAEKLNIKLNELNKFENLVGYAKDGKITSEMIDEAKFIETREQFSAKPVRDTEE